ncbi:FAD-dependent monooxygenase [Pannonibacter tanglangensis]|uniref:FAD-dependent oxidoreductase n=1 Tax=Pannonibacter tanglangensis TaxID=2750084 RepID=A0ABW9ZE34_9HYPH|nr:FAD-dependent monooxygenase [Pannonibacter sp. XCT-34]NBN63102.1 FAD-dependent oxidoreductase [Pannonibacter sp. XCT-34]
MQTVYDVAVVGGGPCGATAAEQLARAGHRVALIDPGNRIKPCGGAIPSRALADFRIPEELLVARARGARVIAPSGAAVEMRIGEIGFVGMVDRATFDPFLRQRAGQAGADCLLARLVDMSETPDGLLSLSVQPVNGETSQETRALRARLVIGADGANSAVRRLMFPASQKPPYVFAYHEIVETPAHLASGQAGTGALAGQGTGQGKGQIADAGQDFRADRCDVIYDGRISPDFYGWVFPHGSQISVGCGSAVKGHDLRRATADLRERAGLAGERTLRREGAPLPLKPMRRWDNGRNVLLAGDAAGTVAPSSGEGIYYAMLCGQLSADAVAACLLSRDGRALREARRRFMKDHGRVFLILGLMQAIWYRSDSLREKFVSLCADPDVQRLTWESYLNKRLVRRDPLAHVRVFFKDLARLFGRPARQP